ncbi:serine/threonine protein kinase [Paenibacillus sp. GCM10023248]|uniref:serine/threonine protein kinase n=1 Tax=unclassified Paenibacillus TaxID=185978 RepID=UPI002379B040|nr:serine/threonine-protein kinase [Paenibacillus sp. MAHUQ-63]MDD9267838.1 serine/threonine-protein kinase [Paenibacillus sp. MAHUQ-63]
MSPNNAWIGTCIGGRYRIEALLGQGGMSQVYLAEDMKLRGKKWAVKACVQADEESAVFLEEAEMLARLQHPQLPQLIDYLWCDGTGFLVMDYIQGPTLQDLFEEKGRELPLPTLIQIASQLCDLLHYLHTFQPRPIIYRDLKPANIMLNEQSQVRLIDFGVARHFTQGKPSDTMQMGTIGFAAPEQVLGLQTDARSDLYSLGAMLYYLLSGGQYAYLSHKPWEKLRPDLPEALTSSLRLLLQEHPEHRCQSAMELKLRLRSIYPDPPRPSNEPLHHSSATPPDQLLVIGGLYAGVGSTFLAVTLARILHALQVPHALVEQPTIAPDLYMLLYGDVKAPRHYTYAAQCVTGQGHSASPGWVNGLSTWVPLPPDGFQGAWQTADSFKLLHTIRKQVVLWDVSTDWEQPSVQEMCHSADAIIVVVDPSPGKCNRPASRARFERFAAYTQRGKKVHYVANGAMPAGLRKEWAASMPAVPICSLPELPRTDVMRAVWKGDFIQDDPGVLEPLIAALAPLLKEIVPGSSLCVSGSKVKRSRFSAWRR